MAFSGQERFLLFWFACIPIRVAVGVLATVVSLLDKTALYLLLGLYAGITCIGFTSQILLTLARRKTSGFLGGNVWWTEARWVHAFLWGMCSLLSFLRVPWAGTLLLADVGFGILVALLKGYPRL